eukprot:751908-Rhodomonas_salina.2
MLPALQGLVAARPAGQPHTYTGSRGEDDSGKGALAYADGTPAEDRGPPGSTIRAVSTGRRKLRTCLWSDDEALCTTCSTQSQQAEVLQPPPW